MPENVSRAPITPCWLDFETIVKRMNSSDGVTERHEPAKTSGDDVGSPAVPAVIDERSADSEHAIAIQIPNEPSIRRIDDVLRYESPC